MVFKNIKALLSHLFYASVLFM